MTPYLKCLAFVLITCLIGGSGYAASTDHFATLARPENGEEYTHLIGSYPTVPTPWKDITNRWAVTWVYELAVDEHGNVVDAAFISGPKDQRDDAARAVRQLKFKPFIHNGRTLAVHFRLSVAGTPVDYEGPPDRALGSSASANDTVIALRRTACFGTCPDYRVELRGDGQVTYKGTDFVLVGGIHRWSVSPTAVTKLVDLIRRADFFRLDGYYELHASDLPTYITRVSIGNQYKFVLDYGGSGLLGDAVASTSFGGPVPNMPAIVTAIEDAIDAAADDASWIKGDKNTVSKLEAAHWNFDSKEAGRALSMLIANCKTDLARQFLTGGAPVNAKGYGWFGGSTPGAAAHCSDPALVRMLIAKGALKNPADKKGFLLSSADSGNPDMVAIALKYFHNTKIRDSDGKPLLSIAAGATSRSDDEEVEASFNSAKVISMLVAAGADVNARDADGNTPLVEAESDEVARVLIKAGANPNARNSDGRTPLFDHYFAEPKKALIEAGADVTIRDKYGATALFNQEDVEAVSAMIAAGADVNATSLNGYTALEDALSEKVAIALINAGAKLPTDPDRLNKLTMRAIRGKWNELLPYLQKAGGAPKAQ